MTMLRDEVAEIQFATNKQIWKLRKLLDERGIEDHFAEIIRTRILNQELTMSEARHAIRRIEGK